MLTEEAKAIIRSAGGASHEAGALRALRGLSIDEFGELLLDTSDFPVLSGVLPHMPSDDVQNKWTGAAGMKLLRESTVPFMRFVEQAYAVARKATLDDVTVIDYGCGWGRYSRMMLKHTTPDKIWGLDPLDSSLQFCRQSGVKAHLRKIDPMPVTLPVDAPADLALAFSVFTHTSEKTTRACLSALAGAVKAGGMLAFTIRPIEFWTLKGRPELAEQHASNGFAFAGDGRIMHGDEDTYGHASMSRAFASQLLRETGWEPVLFDHALCDEYQTRVAAIRA